MLTYRFMDSLEKLEENSEILNKQMSLSSLHVPETGPICSSIFTHSPQCSLIFNARLSANNYLSWCRFSTKLVTPLSTCWFLDTRSPKYLGSMCSGNLTVSSDKYIIFGDHPAEPRISEIGNTKPTSGSLVVISRDKPASTLYSKTHKVFLLGAQYYIKGYDLLNMILPEECYSILAGECLLDYTSDVHLEGYFRILWDHFFINGVMYHMTMADNMSIPKSSLLWSGPLARC